MACGWETSFTGHIIQYGIWPPTKRKHFALRDIHETLQKKYRGFGEDGAIHAGIKDLVKKLLTHTWGDSGLQIERCIIDANWKSPVVKSYCREGEFGTRVMPGHGRFIGADRKALNDYRKATGDRVGEDWRIPAPLGRGAIRHIVYDANHWKSHCNTALLLPPGERGCLQLFDLANHKLVAEHLTSEYYVKVTGRGRTVDHWKLRPGTEDNHWWDCLVGNSVAASTLGCKTVSVKEQRRRRRPVRYMEN